MAKRFIPSAEDGANSTLSQAHPELCIAVVYLAAAQLAASGRKLRLHKKKDIQKLARAIADFGFLCPVLLDEHDRVIVGHARLEAAKLLGMTEVPCIRLDHLDEKRKRLFVIAEQRMGELSGWDREALALEFEELSALDPEFDLTISGFEEPQIDALTFGCSDPEAVDDELPGLKGPIVSRRGDLWLLGDHRLLCGDATEPSDLNLLMAGQLAAVVVTDAPYNVPVAGHVTSRRDHGEFVSGSGEMSDEQFTEFLAKIMRQSLSALSGSALAYMFMDWRHIGNMVDAARVASLDLVNLCVWDKGQGGQGSFYRSQHELCFCFRSGPGPHLNQVELGKHGRTRTNVWACPGVIGFGIEKAAARDMHPTVKPTKIIKDIILDCTRRGDVVLDVFSGSGTTIIACERSHRRGYAMDLDPKYVDVGVRRWEALTGEAARLEANGQTFHEVGVARKTAVESHAPSLPEARVRVRAA